MFKDLRDKLWPLKNSTRCGICDGRVYAVVRNTKGERSGKMRQANGITYPFLQQQLLEKCFSL
jgi:hypothetical protein